MFAQRKKPMKGRTLFEENKLELLNVNKGEGSWRNFTDLMMKDDLTKQN